MAKCGKRSSIALDGDDTWFRQGRSYPHGKSEGRTKGSKGSEMACHRAL